MSVASSRILDWLGGVPDFPSQQQQPITDTRRKRRRTPLPTPSMSGDERASRKRFRIDPEATPKGKPTLRHADEAASASSYYASEASTTGSKRNRSGRSSPTKGLALLQINHFVQQRAFAGDQPVPSTVQALTRKIRDDAIGLGIITSADKEAISDAAKEPEINPALFDDVLHTPRLIDESGQRELLGTMPPLDQLVQIWQSARECELNGHSESSWNCEVHAPLLRSALRYAAVNKRATNLDVEVSHMNVTTAQICKSYLPVRLGLQTDKRIDFCLCLQPRKSADNDKIFALAQQSAHQGINHTEYTPLLGRPICLSIETKRTGEDWKAAVQQTSIWLWALKKRLDELAGPNALNNDELILPGIVIQGHDWYFVAGTPGLETVEASPQMILWSKIPFGSTEGLQGILQIVATLQRLAQWSALTYWPWFRDVVLEAEHI